MTYSSKHIYYTCYLLYEACYVMLVDSNLTAKERVSAEFDAGAAADLLTCLLPKYCTRLQA